MSRRQLQVEELFHQAGSVPEDQRSVWLQENCPDDGMRAEVEQLLQFDQVAGGGLTADVEPPVAATHDLKQSAPGRGPVILSSTSSSAIDHGRFLPGTVLAERYRIVGLLGQGGMGEVYRADDLELGQSVALKFLPKRLIDDPHALERFRGEVRLARQVSHPNVCRVYDISQVAGQWFLSMQYVDGEDLAQLLTRIGRFPAERATELARQLCLGLHAAHEQGVLHRDLKPANIMIDGRGKLLITDFGLAELADEVREDDIRSGTPAYMSPEQLAGREVTQQSDIYSLGIILHEIYTGKPVWEAGSMAELFEQRKSKPTPTASSHLSDLDPLVDRVIQRCLEADPNKRPASALAVTASLPGGDPITAALAAGETPSPAMVAASGEKAVLKPQRAFGLLFGLILLLLLDVSLLDRIARTNDQIPIKPPAVLADRAERLIQHLGYEPEPIDKTFDYFIEKPVDRNVLRFWYRQREYQRFGGQFYNERSEFSSYRPTFQTPAWQYPGETGLKLTPEGKLQFFRSIPALETGRPAAQQTDELPWNEWFEPDACGFILADAGAPEVDSDTGLPVLTRLADQSRTPPDAADVVRIWSGTVAEGETVYVVAAAYHGQPVYFEVLSEAEFNQPSEQVITFYGQIVTGAVTLNPKSRIFFAVINLLLVVAVLMSIYNYRTDRSDRRGSRRVALAVCGMQLVILFSLSHRLSISSQWWPLFGQILVPAAVVWTIYVAIEPLVRKIWPKLLVAWTRLLEGRFTDPSVGQSLLVGAVVGALIWLFSLTFIYGYRQYDPQLPVDLSLRPMFIAGSRELISVVPAAAIGALSRALFTLLILLVLRVSLRHERSALIVCTLVLTVLGQVMLDFDLRFWPIFLASATLQVFTLVRFGFLADVALHTFHMILISSPVTLDAGTWYYGHGVFAVAVVLLGALYGCYTSLGGRSFVRELSK